MQGSTRGGDEAQYPIDADRFTTWAKRRGADISEEDGHIEARWGEETYIQMGDERIECWKPYRSRTPSSLSIEEVEPEPEALSMTSAGRGELREVSIRGDRLEIESVHMGDRHTYHVTVEQ